jgi:acetyl-CoA C-acetyltransferase
MTREAYIVGAARTPIGSFLGALSKVPATSLGAIAIRAAVERSGVEAARIDHVFMGNVLSSGLGQAPARQAAVYAGLPQSTPAVTVGKVCGSGLEATIQAARAVLLGDAEIAVAGGMESMSNAPYLLTRARSGYRMGHGELTDAMLVDGLFDPYGKFHMGRGGELCARELAFTREAQDAYAFESYTRARRAQENGRFARELVRVPVPARGGETWVEIDEEPGRTDLTRMASLEPVFEPTGTITPANASKINDGAAALVVASGIAVDRFGLTPLARIVAYGGHAQAPERFATAPVFATRQALARADLSTSDIDLFEINEAFAVVTMACTRELGISPDRVNIHGGAVALGHPIGASGARIVTTLVHAMQAERARRGVASICIGGGEALALVLERA